MPEDPRVVRRTGLVLDWLLAIAVVSLLAAVVGPIILAGLQVPIPPEIWQGFFTALGAGVALLPKLIDLVKG